MVEVEMVLQLLEELLLLRHDEIRHGVVDAVSAVESLHVSAPTFKQIQDLLRVILRVPLVEENWKQMCSMEVNDVVDIGECNSMSSFSEDSLVR